MQQIKTLHDTDDYEVNDYLRDGWSIQHSQFVPVTIIEPYPHTDVQLHVVLIRDTDADNIPVEDEQAAAPTISPSVAAIDHTLNTIRTLEQLRDAIRAGQHHPLPVRTITPPDPPAPIAPPPIGEITILGIDDPLPADTLDFDKLTFEDIVYEPWAVKREYINHKSRQIYQEMVIEPRRQRMNTPLPSPFRSRHETVIEIVQS